MKDLNEIRTEIETIDKIIAKAFEERMKLSGQVAQYKIAHNTPVFDPKREQELLNKNSELIENKCFLTYYLEVQKKIMEMSKVHQLEIINNKVK